MILWSSPWLLPCKILMKYVYVRCPDFETLESNKYTLAATLYNTYEIFLCRVS